MLQGRSPASGHHDGAKPLASIRKVGGKIPLERHTIKSDPRLVVIPTVLIHENRLSSILLSLFRTHKIFTKNKLFGVSFKLFSDFLNMKILSSEFPSFHTC
jgi:hypothetical protein